MPANSPVTLDHFNTILEAASSLQPLVSNAMLLAITTGQRLDDIAHMRFRDVYDGYLHVQQRKTGSMVRLSLQLRLDALGITVGDVVSRCRDIVVSPCLLHHVRNHLTVKKGDPISRGRISRGFQTARERTSLQMGSPTYLSRVTQPIRAAVQGSGGGCSGTPWP